MKENVAGERGTMKEGYMSVILASDLPQDETRAEVVRLIPQKKGALKEGGERGESVYPCVYVCACVCNYR